jgi:hypothetical protein
MRDFAILFIGTDNLTMSEPQSVNEEICINDKARTFDPDITWSKVPRC